MAALPASVAASMDQPRTILHVICRLDGYGSARMLRHVAADQAAQGHRVTVAPGTADRAVANELAGRGVDVAGLGRRWTVDPVACWRLRTLVERLRPAAIHAWDLAAAIQVAVAGVSQGARLLVTIAGSECTSPWATLALPRIARRVYAFMACDGCALTVLRFCGVDQRLLHLAPGGVTSSTTSSVTRAQLLAHFDLPSDARIIAVAGPLLRGKQFDEAIWCFELLRVLHENAVLLILGDGPDYERLERFAEVVSEPGSVRLCGYRRDIAAILPHADAFWQLSPAFATPFAMLEAEAAGVPVVASDLPAHRAAISEGSTGFLVPLNDRASVVRVTDALLNDSELAMRIVDAARASVTRDWSLQDALNAHRRFYQ